MTLGGPWPCGRDRGNVLGILSCRGRPVGICDIGALTLPEDEVRWTAKGEPAVAIWYFPVNPGGVSTFISEWDKGPAFIPTTLAPGTLALLTCKRPVLFVGCKVGEDTWLCC